MQLQKTKKKKKKKKRKERNQYLQGNDQEISKSITLCIQELMTISMECLPLGVFSEGLYSDLLIQVTTVFLSYRCESGPRELTCVDRLKDCCNGTRSQWFY